MIHHTNTSGVKRVARRCRGERAWRVRVWTRRGRSSDKMLKLSARRETREPNEQHIYIYHVARVSPLSPSMIRTPIFARTHAHTYPHWHRAFPVYHAHEYHCPWPRSQPRRTRSRRPHPT
ncbi:hypothetical protein BOTBODRAFT_592671 [Botryobasidium botryosum FD-172 SS1]|uniref:Uncharacterized protein n=1 Tax=Botryobasidium botryosum (strain FD-172 SS1) TaxID=930990 RepID=A0A067LZN2_BOTB1|nr:hypothetical protein BOTBODRAFT_592671 [Botryobasidium botryosum FD-172 SS1]